MRVRGKRAFISPESKEKHTCQKTVKNLNNNNRFLHYSIHKFIVFFVVNYNDGQFNICQ